MDGLPSSPIFQSQLGLTNQLSNNATPAAFVLPASSADVTASVRCAQYSGLPFSIRGGGHSYVAANLVDGGVVIGMQVQAQSHSTAWACMDGRTSIMQIVCMGVRIYPDYAAYFDLLIQCGECA